MTTVILMHPDLETLPLATKSWRRPNLAQEREHHYKYLRSINSPPTHTLPWFETRTPKTIDESWDYDFRIGAKVLVRTMSHDDEYSGWTPGVISREMPTEYSDDDDYTMMWHFAVEFYLPGSPKTERRKDMFAPLAGDIKPDTPYYRDLVSQWL